MRIEKRYLKLPINLNATSKTVRFFENGTLIFDLCPKLDAVYPQYTAYLDVSRFIGKDIQITVSPDIDITFEQTQEMDIENVYGEPYRPRVHYTVKSGWSNDPNGLIYYRGKYHMFYQYSACGQGWDVHWGHAVSDDLLHWEEKAPALFPDETGMIFSGSAIEDERNVSGLGDNAPMLLFYTGAGNMTELSKGKPFTQCLAYSTDDGETFIRYKNNPIIGEVRRQNRDPKVVWAEEIQKYVMALYLTEADYGIFLSDNLIDWQPLKEYRLENEWECPDWYALTLDGEKYWVVSGADGIYTLGQFQNGDFVFVQKEKKLEYADVAYASQSFSGVKDGRAIKINWNKLSIPEKRFTQQMGIPYELQLQKAEGEIYLAAQPVREIEKLYKPNPCVSLCNATLQKTNAWKTDGEALDIRLFAQKGNVSSVRLGFFGLWLQIDVAGNKVEINGKQMPLCVAGENVDLRIVVDCCSVEIFTDGGKACMTVDVFCDYNLPYVRLETDGEWGVQTFVVHTLESIYNNK